MWVAIWVCFTVFVAVFVGWTLLVQFQQKKAWSTYAKRNKLQYDNGTFTGPPTVVGEVGGRNLSLYTGVQQTDDIRGQRFVTVIEFQMGKGMPTGAAIATKEFSGFIQGLIFDETFKPEVTDWDPSYVVRTRYKKNLQAYLTQERQKTIASLFSMKNAAVLFFFDELEAVLRIETSDPLRNDAHLEKIVKRILSAVEVLSPTAEEKKTFRQLLKDEKNRDDFDEEDEDEDETESTAQDDEGEEDVKSEPEPKEKETKKKKPAAKKKKAAKKSSKKSPEK